MFGNVAIINFYWTLPFLVKKRYSLLLSISSFPPLPINPQGFCPWKSQDRGEKRNQRKREKEPSIDHR